jgi:hypothetical protein
MDGGKSAMRVTLKGVHANHRRLADGRLVTYYYAWRGGPRLIGEPGTPEFIRSYHEAHSSRRKPDRSLFKGSVILPYLDSPEFKNLSARTQADYFKIIHRKIDPALGDLPLDALDDPRVTKDLLEWRDSMASSPRQADYA